MKHYKTRKKTKTTKQWKKSKTFGKMFVNLNCLIKTIQANGQTDRHTYVQEPLQQQQF